MTPDDLVRLAGELEEFLQYCFSGLGRRERCEALGNYLRGLLLDGERKSMLPIAERIAPTRESVEAMRQRLQQAVTLANWDEWQLFQRLAVRVERELPGVDAFVIDDTGFPKKGRHSVGVQRQYSGTLGRVDSCQVAASLHLASEMGGACIGMRLFVPESWASDRARRVEVGMPEEIEHRPKRELAVEMIDRALSWGLQPRPVIADAAYGDSTEFRKALNDRGLFYVLRISGSTIVWPPGKCPSPPPQRISGLRGRPRTKWIAPQGVTPVHVEALGEALPKRRFRAITWREGTRGPQKRRFAALRVRTAHRHCSGHAPSEEQWLLCEWSFRSKKPTAFYLSNLPASTTRKRLVYLAKLRWRIERDYQEMKSELGLDHFEGRTWRGFHHHVACVSAAHAFLTIHRALFFPEAVDDAAQLPGLPCTVAARAASDAGALPAVRTQRHGARASAMRVAHVIR